MAVKMKLDSIQVTTVKEVLKNIIRLNQRLRTAGYTKMHLDMLDAMASIGVAMLTSHEFLTLPTGWRLPAN